jgi:hypothetical protein
VSTKSIEAARISFFLTTCVQTMPIKRNRRRRRRMQVRLGDVYKVHSSLPSVGDYECLLLFSLQFLMYNSINSFVSNLSLSLSLSLRSTSTIAITLIVALTTVREQRKDASCYYCYCVSCPVQCRHTHQ